MDVLTAHDRTQQAVALAELEAKASGMRILLADDSESNRILILSCLKRVETIIDVAANGAIAVELFKSGHYDLVLMDVEMPVLDGFAATREIRRFENQTGVAPTPILALTAHSLSEMTTKGTEAGFTDLLIKPIINVALLEAMIRYRPNGMISANPPAGCPVAKDMSELVAAYIKKKRADIPVYRHALETSDFEAIRQLGHKMKGTGTSYGFPLLTEIGAAIEQAGLQADRRGASEAVERLAVYVEGIPPE